MTLSVITMSVSLMTSFLVGQTTCLSSSYVSRTNFTAGAAMDFKLQSTLSVPLSQVIVSNTEVHVKRRGHIER